MRRIVSAVALVLAAAPVAAQETLRSPYREQQTSEIRGLSPKEIDDFREGRGMGLARAAELNGYTGPRHLLDAVDAGQVHLTPDQLREVNQLFGAMSAEARRLGEKILMEERALETAFRQGSITEPDLQHRLTRIGQLQAELRAVHLRTHLETRALLTEPQIQRYNQVRGYAEGGVGQGQHKH